MRASGQSNRGPWPSGDDDTLFVLLIVVVGGGLLLWLAWETWRTEISVAAIEVFRWQVSIVRHWTDRFELADRQMAAADPARVTFADLFGMARALGETVSWGAAALLLALIPPCILVGAGSRFRRRLDLSALAAEQAKSFPIATAFASRALKLGRPAAQPLPCDPALTTPEWVERHATLPDGGLDVAAARRALAAQLGPPACPLHNMTNHATILLAAFALHRAQHRAEALELLGAASAALAAKREEPSGPLAPLACPNDLVLIALHRLLDAHDVTRPAFDLLRGHAYVSTGLMTLLVEARRAGGVLPPAAFAWLRLVDRPLWYALSSLGFEAAVPGRYLHPNPRVEAAGTRDHWASELAAGRALAEPCTGRAIEAIERAVRGAAPQTAAGPAVGAQP